MTLQHHRDGPPVLVSLFDYSENWARPYADAGWQVYYVDIKRGIDIMAPSIWSFLPHCADVVLAAPPCTDFSSSGAQYWPRKDDDGTTAHSIALVRRALTIIRELRPHYWALENPVGSSQSLRAGVGRIWTVVLATILVRRCLHQKDRTMGRLQPTLSY